MNYRETAIAYLAKNKVDVSDRSIYEFGVWCGASMILMRKYMLLAGLTCKHMFAFDSFRGLPAESLDVVAGGAWTPGGWSSRDYMKEPDIDKIIIRLQGKVEFCTVPTTFIPGFFADSLTPELLKQHDFRPAAFIDIDVDLYISAKQCLVWMFENGLVVPGTLIGYDDWGGTEEYKGGESLAHLEIQKEYGVKFKELFSVKGEKHHHKLFLVESVKVSPDTQGDNRGNKT